MTKAKMEEALQSIRKSFSMNDRKIGILYSGGKDSTAVPCVKKLQPLTNNAQSSSSPRSLGGDVVNSLQVPCFQLDECRSVCHATGPVRLS